MKKPWRFLAATALVIGLATSATSAPTATLTLQYASVNFSSASATGNGHTGTIYDPSWWADDAIMMVSSSGQTKASVSGLDGSSFYVTWKSSN